MPRQAGIVVVVTHSGDSPAFVPGLQLSALFYHEVVAPIVGGVPHCAARLGWGSDVLGYDTPRSTDHGWGPRVQIFVDEHDVEPVLTRVDAALPSEFKGWPTRYGWDGVAPRNWVEVSTFETWIAGHLGFDPRPSPSFTRWLTTPTQLLLGLTRGAVFHDPNGHIGAARSAVTWYPDDLWRYALMCAWQRIGQEEHFVGRTAEVHDDLGSRVLTARLVRDLMKLAFLIERRYAPYSKWFGVEFATLPIASDLAPLLHAAIDASEFVVREQSLIAAFALCAWSTNALGLCTPVDPTPRRFHSRPFMVLDAVRFVDTLRESIANPTIRALPAIGMIDQWSDNVDVLTQTELADRARHLYGLPD